MKLFPPLLSDFYKVSHKDQYPNDTEVIYSNLTARSSRLDGVSQVVFFGLQYFLKEYLQKQFNENFFWLSQPEFERALASYKRRLDNALGGDNDVSHWGDLYDLGYLPLEIKALPEGAKVPLRVPLLTVRNIVPNFFWLGQWMETLLSNVIWYPITTATIGKQYKDIIDKYVKETSDIEDFSQWMCHDFSMRGNTAVESSAAGGAGLLLSFTGTDTIPAIDFLEQYYNANSDKEMVGGSLPATEHSVQCLMGEDGEFDTYQRLLTKVYPSGNISIVSDTYDLWRVMTDYLPKLKDIIINRNGKTIIRPDSGQPEKILCGNPDSTLVAEQRGVVQLLWDVFGGNVNSKSYKQLHPNVGAVYGDSITIPRCIAICEGLRTNGFACTNVVFGIGSFSLQYNTRDTLGLAFKCTSVRRNNVWYQVFKNPKTDSGIKKSAKGLLMVVYKDGEYHLVENVTEEQEQSSWNRLETVYKNGQLVKEYSLSDIRNRLKSRV